MEHRQVEPIPAGAEVIDVDGERLGSVVAASETYIVVERGFFFPTDVYVPRSAITEQSDGSVHINVTKAQALAQGWEVNPNPPETEPEFGPAPTSS